MIRFKVENKPIHMTVEKVAVVGEGAYEKGYATGYETGNVEGYTKGHADGVEQGYANGYGKGFSDGKTDGKIKVSMLPNYHGIPTGNGDEGYYSAISNNGLWTPVNFIPFDGKIGTTYQMTAKMKCGTADNLGVGFIYEDGSTSQSSRNSSKEYFVVSVLSNPAKRVANLGLLYGSGGSGYAKDWMIEIMLEDGE